MKTALVAVTAAEIRCRKHGEGQVVDQVDAVAAWEWRTEYRISPPGLCTSWTITEYRISALSSEHHKRYHKVKATVVYPAQKATYLQSYATNPKSVWSGCRTVPHRPSF